MMPVRHAPSSRLHRFSRSTGILPVGPTDILSVDPIRNDWPNGKSYPVTAAQLLPIFTGFLAPIHFSKLAKNWFQN
jgi:hypothetical protein